MKLSLLSTALLLVGCNEKVSPELQGAASSSTVSDTVTPSEYYFSVENTSSALLNFKLHKTGDGNYNTDCKISQSTALTNDLFRTSIEGDDESSDISCYFDVDELALYFSGLSFDVKASANTCEYVAYSPFSYYNRMPGDSSTNLYEVSCDASSGATEAGIIGAITTKWGATALNHSVTADDITCGDFVDRNIRAVDRAAFTVSSDEELCRYNYTTGGSEQCDEGIINISTATISVDSGTGIHTATFSTRQVKCGGKASNCIRGPIKLLHSNSTNFREISSTTNNTAFSKNYTLPPLITSEFSGNWEYANFRRNLASLNIKYDDSFLADPTNYVDEFSGAEDYTTELMDRYSTNRKTDETTLIEDGASYGTASSYNYYSYERDSDGNLLYKRRPLAAEPFLGLTNPDNGKSYRTQPFYVFYCLDGAYDIKARIRMVVRDWDRVFPTTNSLELISDIDKGGDARQDVPDDVEVDDDGDVINQFNDFLDWDDILFMSRTPGAYIEGTTIWQPSTVYDGDYSDGFFNPLIFPRYYSE